MVCYRGKGIGMIFRNQNRVRVLGVPIDSLTSTELISVIDKKIRNRETTHVLGINADKINEMQKNNSLNCLIQKAEIIHADGISILFAAKILNKHIPERIAGIDLMQQLLDLAQEYQYSVYFLGAKEETVHKFERKIRQRWPNLPIAGTRNGYFSNREREEVAKEIKKSQPQLVFIGITSPKKEYLIDYFMSQGIQAVFMGVGGSFDVLAEEVKRAPLWIQNCHLEWCFRMLQEPRRLFKRYMIGNIKFLKLVATEKIKSTNKK